MADTGEFYDRPRLPMNDERYRIPGTDGFLMSKWSRENEMKDPPRFKVGDVVAYLHIGEITRVVEDCDGTPLYEIDGEFRGISDGEWLRPATEEEANNF